MPWSSSRPPASSRGYGKAHVEARKQWAAEHTPTNLCVRCGRPLGPMGPHLHLDHNRARDGYLGFSHGACNRSAGGSEGRSRQTVTAYRM